MAWSASKSASARRRGVDEQGSAGRRTSSRAMVVWRPFPSPRRSPVARSTAPRPRRLARVDLPAPDGPRSTTVAQGSRNAQTASMPTPEIELTATTSPAPINRSRPRRRPRHLRRYPPWSTPRRGRTALPSQYQETLQPPGSEAALERADDEHLVDVCGEHLRSLGTSGTARTMAVRLGSTSVTTPS